MQAKPQKLELHYSLSHHIINDPEMIAAIIYGRQRLGKTMYAYQVGYDIYRNWDVVYDHTLFLLKDVINTILDAVKTDKTIPYLIWDDAGVYGNKYLFFTNRKVAQLMQGLFDVVGTVIKGFVMTTPNAGNLLKSIREYEFYRVKIIKTDTHNGRRATGYMNDLLPSGTINIRKTFADDYNTRIPDDIYKKYFEKRKGYLKNAAIDLKEYLDELEEHPDKEGLTRGQEEEIEDMSTTITKTKEYVQDRLDDKD